jgi:signal-transduction protein with cAMP-binding, CBS, and nucleotidyltransferase domain
VSIIHVRDAMHAGLASCDSAMTCQAATELMLQLQLRSLVVIDADCGLAGIVTQTDLVDAKLVHQHSQNWEKLPIGEIMHRDVLTVTPDATLEDAARIMLDHHVHRLVVTPVDDPCAPVGVVSMGDIMRHMMD